VLADAPPIAFLATTDAERARRFYAGVLGLSFVADDGFALVFDLAGTMLRLARVERLAPHPFTALGWRVPDVEEAVRALAARGVVFERFDGLEQDELGVWMAPGGTRVTWFQDPDGNRLSVSQDPR
jgi:catechol 2,3-dioxygenase-like lactoylglutathione lyase family enzyme